MNTNEKEMFESCEKEIKIASKELSEIIRRLRKGKASASELKDKEAELTKLYNRRLKIACGYCR